MKRGMILSLLCFMLLFINISFTAQAEGEIPENAVASVKTENSSEIFYEKLDGYDGAIAAAEKASGSTLKLLKNVNVTNCFSIAQGDNKDSVNFTIDFNGKTITSSYQASAIQVYGGTVIFTDSSDAKNGGISGTGSSAIGISGGNVAIESGHYKAETWVCLVQSEDASVKISGGTFEGGSCFNNSRSRTAEISGGTFYGKQKSVWNNDSLTINGGDFRCQIYNSTQGCLDFKGGEILLADNEIDSAVVGVLNYGVLNLSGGKISAGDASTPAYGVDNREDAKLNLLDDVTFNCSEADFLLEKPMNVGAILNGTYSVSMKVPEDGSDIIFANVTDSAVLNKDNFKSAVREYIVKAVNGNNALALSKCEHKNASAQYVCEDCGLQICAQVGETYYVTLEDAFEAVKNATAEDGKVVKVLVDVTLDESMNIPGGIFTLDLNGKKLTGSLDITGGNVTIIGNGGSLESDYTALFVAEGASAEVTGEITIKGAEAVGIMNAGSLDVNGAKISGKETAIANLLGKLNFIKGEAAAEQVAICNIGGTLTVGADDGSGPTLRGETGILNMGISQTDEDTLREQDAATEIKGGEIVAETDIINKADEFVIGNEDEEQIQSGFSAIAGKVTLSGGIFKNGITAVLDEGMDLKDLLAEGYGYFDSGDEEVTVGDGAVSIEETVTVKALQEDTDDENGKENGDDAGTDDPNNGNGGSGNVSGGNTGDQQPGKNDGTAATGDSAKFAGWLIAMILSAMIIVIAAVKRNKKS